MEVPSDSVVMGVPGKVRRQVSEAERERILDGASNYVRYRQIYKEESI
jgi:carbonic anhydrase/acetyltransferase-like protein (isoleucine patch superfamily)